MYKKQGSFSFIALVFMPRLSEQSGTFGMLKYRVRVPDVARYHYAICPLYSATEIVTRLLAQLKIDAGLVSQEWRLALRSNLRRLCIDDIYIDDIRSGWLMSVPDE